MAETEKQKDIYILGIESSCDETAASVVKNGREVLSNVISSQIALHTLYGGVVPEIASRKHIEKINQVIEQALADAHVTLEDITAIAVTYGPGLVGALLVGVSEAKAISFATGIPLVGVHHIEGHISANFIENKELEPPFICLVASGGHSHLVVVKDYGEYEIIGRTRDDAAGEAFDKVARAIGLGYPGGPKIDKVSKEGNPDAIHFTGRNGSTGERLVPIGQERTEVGRVVLQVGRHLVEISEQVGVFVGNTSQVEYFIKLLLKFIERKGFQFLHAVQIRFGQERFEGTGSQQVGVGFCRFSAVQGQKGQ